MHANRLMPLTLGRRGSSSGLAALALFVAALAAPRPVAAATLWNQYNNARSGVASQNFEPAHDSFDSEAADDVAVPPTERWRVKQVLVDGSYLDGAAGLPTGVNVTFYTNSNKSLPKTAFASAVVVPPAGFADPDFVLPLPTPVILRPGKTYWVSVQVNEPFADGQWFWAMRDVQSGNPAAWRRPNSSGPCTSFGSRATTCGVGGGVPDQT